MSDAFRQTVATFASPGTSNRECNICTDSTALRPRWHAGRAGNFYAIVKDKDTGSGAFELLADPQTGAVFPEMGPNMMWNTRYSPMSTAGGMMGGMGGVAPGGMMSGTWGPTAPATQPTVTADQSKQIAQQWLDQYPGGSATEAPDTFPGYYTLHITKGGTISGMLSVNAYTGQVCFHTWHGTFVGSTEM